LIRTTNKLSSPSAPSALRLLGLNSERRFLVIDVENALHLLPSLLPPLRLLNTLNGAHHFVVEECLGLLLGSFEHVVRLHLQLLALLTAELSQSELLRLHILSQLFLLLHSEFIELHALLLVKILGLVRVNSYLSLRFSSSDVSCSSEEPFDRVTEPEEVIFDILNVLVELFFFVILDFDALGQVNWLLLPFLLVLASLAPVTLLRSLSSC